MTIVYDTGVLVAADRNDRAVWADHAVRLAAGIVPTVTAPVVAQASRSSRQVPLRRFLSGCDVIAFEPSDAHQVGALLARSGTSDVVDAHVAFVASHTGRTVLTSDLGDLRALARHLRPKPVVKAVR